MNLVKFPLTLQKFQKFKNYFLQDGRVKERHNKSEGKYNPSVCRILEAQGSPIFVSEHLHMYIMFLKFHLLASSNKKNTKHPQESTFTSWRKYKNMSDANLVMKYWKKWWLPKHEIILYMKSL